MLLMVVAAPSFAIEPASAGANTSRLNSGERLVPGQKIVSPDGRFRFILQGDGNLVLYMGSRALWNSNTVGSRTDRLVMQGDGNLVMYRGSTPVWYSRTDGRPGAYLAIQNDGNVVIYQGSAARWSTGTCCHPAAPPPLANAFYNRSAAVNWALAHARDLQETGALCTVFVSRALNNGGFAQTQSWRPAPDARAWSWVADFKTYFRSSSNASTTWTDITTNFTTNAVPQALPGDVIIYDWTGDGALDHMAFVVDIAPGQYPEVSEMGTAGASRIFPRNSSYQKRGWTWSANDNNWLQANPEYQGMRAYLLHFNGGYFVGSF
jgi:hypothetical protein